MCVLAELEVLKRLTADVNVVGIGRSLSVSARGPSYTFSRTSLAACILAQSEADHKGPQPPVLVHTGPAV